MANASDTITGAVVTLTIICPPTSLVQNPGFETGTFTNWDLSGNVSYSTINGGGLILSGTYAANFGNSFRISGADNPNDSKSSL